MLAQYPLTSGSQYAFTQRKQIYTQIFPLNQPDLISRVATALIGVGWEYIEDVSGPGGDYFPGGQRHGVRLAGFSPQGFSVFLDITWAPYGYNDFGFFWGSPVFFQFRSSIGSGAVGGYHVVDFAPGYTYQIVANMCGFFFSRPGVRWASVGSSACGSIPYVDGGCGFGKTDVNECWWSMGDSGNPFVEPQCPRLNLGLAGGITSQNCGCMNGVVTFGASGAVGSPQILRISSGAQDSGISMSTNPHPVWMDGGPVLYPALIQWGDNNSAVPGIRGTIYDAILRSRSYPMDATETWDGYDWMNYTDSYWFGSLWVITNNAIDTLNVAY